MSASTEFRVTCLRFEHFRSAHHFGSGITRPRLSWKFENAPDGFCQSGYTIELYDQAITDSSVPIGRLPVNSAENVLVPWPQLESLKARQRVFARVKAWNSGVTTAWSAPASIEMGLLTQDDWKAQRITAPWNEAATAPQPEDLFRKDFGLRETPVAHARPYITAQGVYQPEINGHIVGDHFLAPGWTVYDRRLQYQTYDVTHLLTRANDTRNILGVRVAEGWFCGRISFDGGKRNIWGDCTALIAQLEVTYQDGTCQSIVTDDSWLVCQGPTRQAEIYDGEKYDARREIPDWSSHVVDKDPATEWKQAKILTPLSSDIQLVPQEAEPVRRIEVLRPIKQIKTPGGKAVLDFGQNIVGYTRLKHICGNSGHVITISHAEVLENGELAQRPLRMAANVDVCTLKGEPTGESWEPRFTFHGFRYVQIDGWTPGTDLDIMESFEAVVCHTDMERVGNFECSDGLLNKLYQNVVRSMRGNFLSIPTDCPQRDERLGWTGDIAIFAPTACRLYDPVNMLQSWLEDLQAEQGKHGGIPPAVVPYVLEGHLIFGWVSPCALWCDAAVSVPWALYESCGDLEILRSSFASMVDWLTSIPQNTDGNVHLWKDSHPQLGDWLDPSAPPDKPNEAKTDAVLVSNAYLIRSLEIVTEVARLIGEPNKAEEYQNWARVAREEFAHEYITSSGRLVSDAQTAYALAIAFDLISLEKQQEKAAERLSFIVRRNAFQVGTGSAGTPLICEALAKARQPHIAYSMLLNKECPSWLYPVTKGATTIWERWDSMLADDSINPGEMTSFNHYALGAVALFLIERIAGLKPALPGWKKITIAPLVGGDLSSASASIETPYGKVSSSWNLEDDGGANMFSLYVVIPPNTTADIVFPEGTGSRSVCIQSGEHTFRMSFVHSHDWPVEVIRPY